MLGDGTRDGVCIIQALAAVPSKRSVMVGRLMIVCVKRGTMVWFSMGKLSIFP